MIWVILWATGVLTFLYFFFGRRLLRVLSYLVASVVLIALLIAAGLGQDALVRGGYGGALDTASRLGWFVLIGAVVVLMMTGTAFTIYALRHRDSGTARGTVVRSNRPLALSLGNALPMGRSKRRILFSTRELVTMESLVDGTATPGERLMVWGSFVAAASFFLVFVGSALILMKTSLFALVFLTVPGLWLGKIARTTWRDYRNAKTRAAGTSRSRQGTL